MRTSILILLLWGLAVGVSAQEFAPITCPDTTVVTPQMTITLPPQSPAVRNEPPEPYFVSVIPDEGIPSLANTDENAVVTCAAQDGLAEMVIVVIGVPGLDSLGYGGSNNVWIAADTTTENTVAVGELSGYQNFIIIEGGRMTRDDNDGDVYTFTIDPSILGLEDTYPFEFALLSTDGTYNPGFSLLSETGEVINGPDGPQRCVPDQCEIPRGGSIGAYTGLRVPSYQAQYAQYAQDYEQPRDVSDLHYRWSQPASTIRLRVEDTNTEGAYTLIINLHVPPSEPEAISAQAIDNGDGSWMVRCNGDLAFENGIKLTLDTATISPDNPLTLTALGGDSPVTMAVFTSPTEGTCVPPSEAVSSYSVTLSDFNVAPTLNGAQVTLDAPPAYVLVGSAQPSPISLLVEGWKTPLRETLVAEENPDLAAILQPLLSLDVTPGMINTGSDMRAYAIAADDLADPVIGILNDAGQPATDATGQITACDNAGIPDYCGIDSVSLAGYSVTLAEGRVLPGASLDAMVRLSFADLLTQVDPGQPRLHLAAADRTGAGGPMVLLLSLALGE